MNGNSILLDTNIVLYLLNGDQTLIPLLENKQLIVSFITELELLSYKGIKSEDQAILKEFLSECLIVDINQLIKENTVLFKDGPVHKASGQLKSEAAIRNPFNEQIRCLKFLNEK